MSNCCFRKLIIARATTVNRLNYTPSKGELLIDSDTCIVYVGDGVTPGGNPIGTNETLTVLQRIGDILRYTDEDGVDTDIDLSDLVNDARVVSASLNPTTSIVTFTRDDASTFTLDLTALASQDASEVEFTPCAPLTSINVQDAICELLTQVQNGDFETLTTLQKIGNTLRYVDEDGVQTDIDLSIYLDDTNLARLVSGTLNSTTGILTVTRDDASTFTIDLSELLDNQDASEVPFTPCGDLSSTDVQAAICELEGLLDTAGTSGPLCAIQLRRTTDLYGTGSYIPVPFDEIIIENNTAVLERDDTNTSRVKIKADGLYQITYSITHDIETSDFQYFKVTVNGTTDLDQSIHTHRQNGSVDSDYYNIHNTFAAELNENDYIELEFDGNSSSHLENCRIHFYVVKLQGMKGDKGDTGAGSNIVVQKDDVTVGTVTDTLNFEGNGVTTVVDEGSNKTTVTITNTNTCDYSNGGESTGANRTLGNNDNFDLSFKTNNLNRIEITNSGEVGIGNTPSELFEVRRTPVGSSDHVQFILKDTLNTDDFNLGIDTSDKGSAIFSFEDGSKRQAVVFGADTNGGNKTILGVGSSSDSGSSWGANFVVTFDKKVGIGKHSPTEALDMVGNIALTGTVDGRDVAADGIAQDNHIADTTIHFTQAEISITESQISDLSNYAIIGGAHHDGFSDFVANEHIDHTSVTLTAGAGLTGGGDISSNRSFDVNVQNSIEISVDTLQLAGDTATPGNNKVYGTNGSGVKGWKDDPAGGGSGDVTSSLNITDNRIVRGDGGAKGIQHSDWVIDDDGKMSISKSRSGYLLDIRNSQATPGGGGLKLCGGETHGDIALKICDADGTFNILEIEADNGHITLGKTFAQTETDNTTVYGVDNQHNGDAADFNTQSGGYRIAGDLLNINHLDDVDTNTTSPNVGDVLEWDGSNWVPAAPSGGCVENTEVSATSEFGITSTSMTLISGMTITPASGTYFVSFSSSGRGTQDNQEMRYCLFKAGTGVGHSERDMGFEANNLNEDKRMTMHTQAVITVNGSQTIEAKASTNHSQFKIFERSMTILKVC